ncbi:Glycosyltransferase involved in cell wall bisynthesis [Tistlia consotensis]|uniref:Glycosyltransferase involved in cell wall bisynthesis n=1 Tax=Tistlia consotensis USBA 355 TaxID=560819 RepID=A0A1Y6CFM1_9PROT|nr:hypothetical protein [Tistlia consotensis]SMF58939.1 Glycosyltransferase involved in cell wall bisynthesis [Tistlia consotensis USBA 355]SNR64001.1 Glycosyltransferase involved in cell wall bisynthesis [Tistlia consotensis]
MADATTELPAGAGRLPFVGRLAEAARDTALGYRQWLEAELDSARAGRRAVAVTARHALLVASSLPPRFDGGVFRPLSWLKYAGENGWRLSAVTRAPDGEITEAGRQLAAAIPAGVRILAAEPPALRPSHKLFQQIDGDFLQALALYRAAARGFAEDPPSVVVATGPTFASFAAGLLLARRFAARLVLDYRDEWSRNPFGFVRRGRDDRRWERRCLARADLVQFTTRGQLRHNSDAFPGLIGAKGAVLLNGWEPDPAAEAAEPRGDGRLVLAFSGVLGTMASPQPFLDDLAAVLARRADLGQRLRLRFIGRRLPWAERLLERFPHPQLIERIEQRPRAEADRLIRESDVLLLMTDDDMARYLPGKVFEYLATGRPILAHGADGEAPALVRQLGAGRHVAAGAPVALERALDAMIERPAEAWNGAVRRDWAATHTRRQMARVFFGRLSGLVEAAAAREAGR